MRRPPNPGSPAAVERGCACPSPPEGNSPTDPSAVRHFTVDSDCPVHSFVAGWTADRAWTIEEVEAKKVDHSWL